MTRSFWIKRSEGPPPGTAEPLDDPGSGLADGAKPLAAAFAAFTAVLTTLGVQTGELGAIFSLEPWRALFMVCLIGVATAGGIVAPIINKQVWVRYGLILGIVAITAAMAWVAFPDFTVPHPISSGSGSRDIRTGGADWLGLALVVIAIAVIAITTLVSWGRWLRATSAVLLTSLLLLGTGLYGSIKLVSHTRVQRGKVVQVIPTVTVGEHGATLAVVVRARSLPLDTDVQLVVSFPEGSDSRVRLNPNGDGSVDEKLAVPIPPTAESVTIEGVLCQEVPRAEVLVGAQKAGELDAADADLPDTEIRCEVIPVGDVVVPTTTTTTPPTTTSMP